ncbi:hypothetical protein C8Q77DRAFT_1114016 [Trametes polyzona]|nr:hypothetical protein C8Q77DRAFT_1114016 [Trametes polyzona]
MPDLPPEIIDRVLDYLHKDHRTLAACALAGRVMVQTTRYHRFRELQLSPKHIPTLIALVDASPEFAHVVSSVWVRFAAWTDPKSQLAFLSRLPALRGFGMITPPYQRVSVEHLATVASHVPALTHLYLRGPAIITAALLLSALFMFRDLREVRLHGIDVYMPVDSEIPYAISPPPQLQRLSSRASDGALLINQWLQAHGAGLRSLQHFIQDPRDAMQLSKVVDLCANTVKDLEVVFLPEGRMADALRDCDFTLAPFSVLESCTLRFAFGEMCVPQNESLASIPDLLSQLSSPSLRTITVSLVVDNVEDLRSLNSECAVRNLSPAYFDDMRVLDWVSIQQALVREDLGSLCKVVLEGQGSREALDHHMQTTCPLIHSRRLVTLTTVDVEDHWW